MTASETQHNGYASAADADEDIDATQKSTDDDLADAFAAISTRWSELREYASFYIAANVDQLRLSARTTAMWAILGIVVALVASSIVAAGSVLFVIGLSNAVGHLLDGRIWLGQLLVGLVILAAASVGVWFVVDRQVRAYRRAMKMKYELRKQNERAEYGTDIEERAKQRSRTA
jgi:hypothetical protein